MIQEFQISVTPLGQDEYLVRTENVAQGVPPAEEKVRWSIDDWWEQTMQLMNDPLLSLLQEPHGEDEFLFLSGNTETNPTNLNLVALGRQLYDALFQGSLRDSWISAQGIAKYQRSVLRLRLGLKDKLTARLPWEVMHAGVRGSYGSSFHPLATGIDVAFSRYQPNTAHLNPMLATLAGNQQPLNILMVIAGPDDQESLALKQEAMHLQAELSRHYPNSPHAIELTLLEQPGREELTQALEQGQYQVFHYAGHSNLDASGGNIYLVSRHSGLTEKLHGNDLAGLLVNNGVQLAVFNSCRGANAVFGDEGEDWQGRSLAQALVKRGVSAVLAMAERIPDEVALTLTRLLYRNINQGHPIDVSLSRARQGLISAYGSNQLYWALPVLYLNPNFDGVLVNPNEEQNAAFINNVLGQFTSSETMALSVASPANEELDDWEESEELGDDLAAAFIKNVLEDYSASESLTTAITPSSSLSLSAQEDTATDLQDEHEEQTAAFIRDVLSEFAQEESALVPINAATDTQLATTATESLAIEENSVSRSGSAHLESSTAQTSRTQKQHQENNPPQPPPKSRRWLPQWLWLLGISGIGVFAAIIFGWWFTNRNPRPEDLLPAQLEESASVLSEPQPEDLAQAETPTVTGNAITDFSQGNISAGVESVETLLDRGALKMAKTALDAVANQQLDDPRISFVRGRLAWQFIREGNRDYDFDDARRFWQQAASQQPDVEFLNALGFAYYAEGKFNEARQAWYDAVEVIETGQASEDVQVMNTYAGLALGIRQLAQNQSGQQRQVLLKKAIKLRQKVLSAAPEQFQTEALGNNWLWSPSAIQDWQSLLETN